MPADGTTWNGPHILSQPWPWPHTRNHIAMLGLALRQHDRHASDLSARTRSKDRCPIRLMAGLLST
ncbi:DUF3703 domain-containing protein [Streptomyces sp. NPDC056638]|uniref:DUF3703 domain-containing protein n=1 Tax=Streptomyces sp. NPDC056638 TaxID=3345887 RepID=UPI0036A72FB6